MAREYARIRISINSDQDFASLSIPGQWLYTRILVPEPTLSHCGVADWRPARLLRRAYGVTTGDILAAAAEIEHHRFALFDTDTEEVLVRSYIRGEELLRNPKMAVAVIGAYHAVASPILRAAVVSEVRRANKDHPNYSSWTAGDVGAQLAELMGQQGSDQVPYVDTITNQITNQISNRISNQITNGITNTEPVPITNDITNTDPGADYQSDSVPIPCSMKPADTSLQHETKKKGGYVSTEGHQPDEPNQPDTPPPRFCPQHMPHGTTDKCGPCQTQRHTHDRWLKQQDLTTKTNTQAAARADLAQRQAERETELERQAETIAKCQLCDDDGYRPNGLVCDHTDRTATAARGSAAARAALTKGNKP